MMQIISRMLFNVFFSLVLLFFLAEFVCCSSELPNIYSGDFCSSKSIIIACSQIAPQLEVLVNKCPEFTTEKTCKIYKRSVNNVARHCDGKQQCRIRQSKALKHACAFINQSLNLFYICKSRDGNGKSFDIFERSTKPDVDRPTKKENQPAGCRNSTNEFVSTTKFENALSSPTASLFMATITPKTKIETTIPQIMRVTMNNATPSVDWKPSPGPTLFSDIATTDFEDETMETVDKNSASTNSSGFIGNECYSENGEKLSDGNYTWQGYKKYFIQCRNGFANWESCAEDHFYMPKCKMCFPTTYDNETCQLKLDFKLDTTQAITEKDKTAYVVTYPTNPTSQSFNYCPRETLGDLNFKGRYTFQKTLIGHTFRIKCQYGPMYTNDNIERKCLYQQNGSAFWEKVNTTICAPKNLNTFELMKLKNILNVTVDTVRNYTSRLKAIYSNIKVFDKRNILLTSNLIAKSLTVLGVEQEVGNNLIPVISGLSEVDKNVMLPEESLQIRKHINKLGQKLKIPRGSQSIKISSKNLVLTVVKAGNNEIEFPLKFSDNTNDTSKKAYQQSIKIPKSAINSLGEDQRIYFYGLKNDGLFHSSESNDIVVSNVIAATVDRPEGLSGLSEAIEINLLHHGRNSKKPVICKFWKQVNSSHGKWMKNGCTTHLDKDSKLVTCRCNHLTNFALLLDVEQNQKRNKELEIVSFVGCIISILALGLTLVTFICFKKMRSHLSGKILICLCVSILFLLVIFVVGIEKTSTPKLCHFVSGLVHYFTLTTFSWMFVEAIHLYRSIVNVFTTGDEPMFCKLAFLLAWGIPAIIVGIGGILTRDRFRIDEYPGEFCMVTGSIFYYLLLLPVCLIILANLIVFLRVFKGIFRGNSLLKDSIQDRQKAHGRRAKASFAIIVILGLSWVFGVLAIGDARSLFQWLFCVLTTLQGFFIFILYVVCNKDARKHWEKIICCCSSRKPKQSYSNDKSMKSLSKETTSIKATSIPSSDMYGGCHSQPLARKETEGNNIEESGESDNENVV